MRDHLDTSKKQQYINSLIKTTQEKKFLAVAEKARKDSVQIGKNSISLTLLEANCLHQIIKQFKCKNFAEIGSLTGFSAIFILSALQDHGKLFCFEKEDKWGPFLEENLKSAQKLEGNLNKSFSVFYGDALLNLKKFSKSDVALDGFFIDANKSAYLDYLQIAEDLLKKNGIIIADNIFLDGSVWGEKSERFSKNQIEVMNEFNKRIFDESRFISLILDTSDGMVLAIKQN